MEKKYEVFVSSTYIDLIKERQEVMEAILNAGHIPVGMELFKAGTPQEDIIRTQIEEADIYVLILGARYGSIRKHNISYTNWEYNLAIELKKPIFSIVLTEDYIEKKFKKENLPLSFIEYSHPSYIPFKKEVQEKLVWNLKSIDQIRGFISDSISDFDKKYGSLLVGWVKNPHSITAAPVETALNIFDKIEYDNDERLLLLCAVESENPFFQLTNISPSILKWENKEISSTFLSDNYFRILDKLHSKELLDNCQSVTGQKQFRIKQSIYLQLKTLFSKNSDQVNGLKLRKKPKKAATQSHPKSSVPKPIVKSSDPHLYLTRNSGKSKKVITATCRQTADGYLVLKGSMIEPINSPQIPFKIAKKRAELRVTEFEFLQEDVFFKSPTYAAAFVIGGHTNGKDDWKTKEGYSLNDLERQKQQP